MSPFDLTNLAALKAWLGLPSAPGPNDATLTALVTAASRTVYAALSRPSLLPRSFTETIDLETSRVTLRHWPVLQVTSATWRGIAVPPDENADLAASFGYALAPDDGVPPGRPQALDLFGHQYGPGRQSLVVSYSAGYAVQNETQTVPAAAPFQFSALFALRTVGIGSRRDLRCNRRAPDAGFNLAGCWPICGQRRDLYLRRGRRRAIGFDLLRLRAAGYRAGDPGIGG